MYSVRRPWQTRTRRSLRVSCGGQIHGNARSRGQTGGARTRSARCLVVEIKRRGHTGGLTNCGYARSAVVGLCLDRMKEGRTQRHSQPRSSQRPLTILPTSCPPLHSYCTPAQRFFSPPEQSTSTAYHSSFSNLPRLFVLPAAGVVTPLGAGSGEAVTPGASLGLGRRNRGVTPVNPPRPSDSILDHASGS